MKPLTQAPPVSSSVSWWLSAKREDFTKTVEKEQQTRMSLARITGRVSVPDEWHQR